MKSPSAIASFVLLALIACDEDSEPPASGTPQTTTGSTTESATPQPEAAEPVAQTLMREHFLAAREVRQALIGDDLQAAKDAMSNVAEAYPAADVLLEIAALKLANDDVVGPEDVRPLYMREPDARINWTDFREEGMWPGAAS